ncbi:hypothetical protein JK358_12440 [Nocardia sp. 2]|uniref:Excreted virulence factor EspC (Type VII ESX diderm) n=1 Tax=Nocardia acididurans TaxID=2802282 RepID=A0ABS1M4E2_9NOCA|nr:type VII secretion target [Nocardia acididurans]MBL1075201.1 hypothetical protein [Nocardia acididurans]
MTKLIATPEIIREYGNTNLAMSTAVATAAAADTQATVAAAIPVFGLIGQDFLLSFVFAQGNQVAATAELAAVFAGTALTAHQAAASYDAVEADSSHDFISLTDGPAGL